MNIVMDVLHRQKVGARIFLIIKGRCKRVPRLQVSRTEHSIHSFPDGSQIDDVVCTVRIVPLRVLECIVGLLPILNTINPIRWIRFLEHAIFACRNTLKPLPLVSISQSNGMD